MDDLPLISIVAVSVDAVLKEWRREVRAFTGGAVVVAAILCLLMFLLAKEVGRRETMAEKLRSNEERFRAFAEAAGGTLQHVKPHGALYTTIVDSTEHADAVAEAVKRAVRAAVASNWGKKPLCLVHILTI